jgi:hypothetical protein
MGGGVVELDAKRRRGLVRDIGSRFPHLEHGVVEADDVVHDAIVTYLEKQGTLRPGPIGGWIRNTAYNVAMRSATRRDRMPLSLDTDRADDGHWAASTVGNPERVALARAELAENWDLVAAHLAEDPAASWGAIPQKPRPRPRTKPWTMLEVAEATYYFYFTRGRWPGAEKVNGKVTRHCRLCSWLPSDFIVIRFFGTTRQGILGPAVLRVLEEARAA